MPSGQGFAFNRKQKFRHEYNKLLRKERKNKVESKQLYKEEYPEHLRHLYIAEAEKLSKEAWTNRINRSKQRLKLHEKVEERGENVDADAARQNEAADSEVSGGSQLTDSAQGNEEPAASPEKER